MRIRSEHPGCSHVAIRLNKTYPLWTGSTAVDAAVVLVCLCDLAQLGASLRVYFPHFTHLGCVACTLLGVGGMRKEGRIIGERAVEMSMVGRQAEGWAALGWYAVIVCCCCAVTCYVCECFCE
jgi:hypothetical protein